jgi:hypothetical protein
MNTVRRYTFLSVALICSVMALPAFAQSDKSDFQQGKIVAVDRVTAPAMSPGDVTDHQLMDSVDRYNVSIEIGEETYVYQDTVTAGQEVPWKVGQTREVRLGHDSIKVKRITGDIETYDVVSRKSVTAER